MSEHNATIFWQGDGQPFATETYTRKHTWSFPGGIQVPASSAPEYRGDWDRVDPEKGLVAALSSCHMLTFLAVAAKRKLVVTSYRDEATGILDSNETHQMVITKVILRPKTTFAGTEPTPEELRKLHDSAHRNCFIANSVRCDVDVEL